MRLKLSQVYFQGQCREEMDHYLFSISDNYRILPCIVCTQVFRPNFRENSISFKFFNSIFIYLYLDTCFLYYKGILAFIFEHVWYKRSYVTNN